MFEKIKENTVSAILSAAIIGVALTIWDGLFSGALIRALSGATAGEFTELSERVEALEGQQDQGVASSDFEVLNTRVKALEGQQNQGVAPADFEVLNTRVTALEGQQKEVVASTEFGALSEKVSVLEGQQRTLAVTSADFTALSGKVTALEERRNEPVQVPLEIVPQLALEPTEIGFRNTGAWGIWSQPAYCRQDQYVCGLNQKVEPDQRDGDDTTMNGMMFYCCSFPQLATAQNTPQ